MVLAVLSLDNSTNLFPLSSFHFPLSSLTFLRPFDLSSFHFPLSSFLYERRYLLSFIPIGPIPYKK